MKGLLIKDWYMMKKYCRAYLFITIVFIAVSFVSDNNQFFVFYPCMLCGMIPVNLLAYDERSHWTKYSATMPYTKAQIVSAKYLIGLFTQIAILTITAIAQIIRRKIVGGGSEDGAVFLLMVLSLSTLASAIPLPFVFKYGVEKGRIAYYIMIGAVCAAGFLASEFLSGPQTTAVSTNLVLTLCALAAIGIYVLSWYLSVVFYRKRESAE